MNVAIRHGRRWIAIAVLGLATQAQAAITLGADFSADYTVTDLGSIASLPPLYGGVTFLSADTVLIGGDANTAEGRIYQASVLRDPGTNRITGFGTATLFRGGSIGTYNDGGVVFGPGGVLFTSQWPVNMLGQTKPGSLVEDKVIDLTPLGVADSHAAINFVPSGFGGAGQVKMVSWSGGEWYSAALAPDGSGTFDLTGIAQVDVDSGTPAMDVLAGGPEGFVYVAGSNPDFGANSMLLSEFSAGTVGAFDLDANGNPIRSSRRDFLNGLEGAEGATLDPLTGDFLFSTFGGGDRLVLVSGFTAPPPPLIPEPETYALMLGGLAAMATAVRRRRRA
jgi:hypothetical protein